MRWENLRKGSFHSPSCAWTLQQALPRRGAQAGSWEAVGEGWLWLQQPLGVVTGKTPKRQTLKPAETGRKGPCVKRPYCPCCFRNKHHGSCLEDCPAYWKKGECWGNTDTPNLMLGLSVPTVQEVERRSSKSVFRNGQGAQDNIQEGFLEEMTLLMGLRDK